MAARLPRLPGGGGFNLQQDAFNALRYAALLAALTAGGEEIIDLATGKNQFHFLELPGWLTSRITDLIGKAEQDVGSPIFRAIISASAGVDLSSAPGRQEAEAVKMVERMLGFAIALPFVTGEIRNGIKALLGEHAPEALLKAVEEIPLDLGINFFIGTVLERIFETAVSRPLEEAIAEQKRPARMEWPQIRALARQKAITAEELTVRLERAGWRDVDIPLLLNLDRQMLPVADLQAAYLFGLRDEGSIREYLDTLGFNDADRQLIIDVYLKRAETAGATMLRAVSQKGFLDGKLSEEEYKARLVEANVPSRSIGFELEAANLVKSWQHKDLSLSEIKRLYDNGILSDAQAHVRLVQQKFSEEDATLLINDWKAAKALGHPGLTENRILAYLKGGVLTKVEAYDRLVALGVRPQDATFLVDHPDTAGPATTHPIGRSAILAALKDEIIDQPTAERLLRGEGESEEGTRLLLAETNFGIRRGKKPRQPEKVLSSAQIIEAFKLGLSDATWAVRELVTTGYTEADAMLLVTIEITKLAGAIPPDWQVLT